MRFGSKSSSQIDLGDLKDQKENLANFLKSHLNVDVTINQNTLTVSTESLSAQKLLQAVTKFLYHKNLNNTYWAALNGSNVKINKFENKSSKTKKPKKESPSKTIMQTWGL